MTDPFLYLIFVVPIAISVFCKFALQWKISPLEFGAQALVVVLSLSLIWFGGNATANYDTEILNGQVTDAKSVVYQCPTNTSETNCRNSFSCNCHEVCSGSGKDKSCHTDCDTCYEYSWEQNWYVYSNVPGAGEVEIRRVDEQGKNMPDRWRQVNIGDPVSAPHQYKNWVKASSRSLYHSATRDVERYKSLIPEYPSEIYDYYNIDRIAAVNTNFRNEAAWNAELSKTLTVLGPAKQINMVVVIVGGVDRSYTYAVRRQWEGFKKNDAIVFIGVDKQGVIQWGDTMSWSKKPIFNIELRNMIEDMKGQNVNDIAPKDFFAKVSTITTTDFVRRPMKEFEYLKGDIPAPNWLKITSLIVAILLGVGTSILFNRIDLDYAIFSGNSSRRFRY